MGETAPLVTQKELAKKIYKLMYSKLRGIQLGNNFDTLIEETKHRTYKGKSDDDFFASMVICIFGGGFGGWVVEKKMPAIKEAFFNVEKVARYTERDFDRLMKNEDIIRNPMKIRACMHNAREMRKLAEEYGSFEKYIDQFIAREAIEQLEGDIKKRFKFIGDVLIWDFLKDAGIIDCLKPSRDVVRVFSRLGLIDVEDDAIPNRETIKKIQKVALKMAEEAGEKLATIDAVIWLYGSGNKRYVKKAVCKKRKPLCAMCGLKGFCRHRSKS